MEQMVKIVQIHAFQRAGGDDAHVIDQTVHSFSGDQLCRDGARGVGIGQVDLNETVRADFGFSGIQHHGAEPVCGQSCGNGSPDPTRAAGDHGGLCRWSSMWMDDG